MRNNDKIQSATDIIKKRRHESLDAADARDAGWEKEDAEKEARKTLAKNERERASKEGKSRKNKKKELVYTEVNVPVIIAPLRIVGFFKDGRILAAQMDDQDPTKWGDAFILERVD